MSPQTMKPATLHIRKPTAVPKPAQSAPTYRVDKPLKGLKVGLRTDPGWLSWTSIAGQWAVQLRRDGADASVFPIAEHVGPEGEKAIKALGEWADTLDCAVIGIGT